MKTTKSTKIYSIREIICRPVYTGLGGLPEIISNLQWINAAKIAIEIYDKNHFLINLSASLEKSFDIRFIRKEEWIKEEANLLQKDDIKKVMVDMLYFLREFFIREVVNKYTREYHKNWRITSAINVV